MHQKEDGPYGYMRAATVQATDWADPRATAAAGVGVTNISHHVVPGKLEDYFPTGRLGQHVAYDPNEGFKGSPQPFPGAPTIGLPISPVPGAPTIGLPTPPVPGAPIIGQPIKDTAELPTTAVIGGDWVHKAKKRKHAYTFLEHAVKEMKDRAEQRDVSIDAGTPNAGERSMASTVRAFNALTGKDLTEAEGWEFMILLKLVRGRQGAFRADDYTDAAAYAALLGECESTSR